MILNGNPKREKTTKVVSFINKLFFWFLVPPYTICNNYKMHLRFVNVAYRICDISHMKYATFTECICDISHMRFVNVAYHISNILHMRYLTLQNAYAIYISTNLSLVFGLGLFRTYHQ